MLPLYSYSESNDLDAHFQGNFLHVNITIPENHRIYVKGEDSIQINLDDSVNLQKYETIIEKPLSRQTFGKKVKFYENNLDIKISITPEKYINPVDINGSITYEICRKECRKISHELNIEDCFVDRGYILNILFLALLGGFILNFMPCVLPVLSLKVFSIIKSKENQKTNLIFSILGIFFIFWILASSSVILKWFGLSFGIGFHFQEPLFIIFLTSLMTIFVSNIMVGINMEMPSFLSKLNFKGSYLNSFASGALAAIFSTPCTAPFLGTAIAFAAISSNFEIFLIFSSIALGFSLPYISLIIWPNLLKFMPKPGKWMDGMKKFLAILMIITIFWLLTILYAQLGFRATFGVILLLLLVKFISEQKMKSFWKVILYILIFLGLYNLPHNASKEDYKKQQEIKEIWQDFTHDALKEAMENNKIVVIDITADWCGTCKYNKFLVWNRQRTIDLLSNDRIVALRKDITSRSYETQKFMQSIGVYGIPFNIIFGPDAKNGIILPTLISYDEIERALKEAGL